VSSPPRLRQLRSERPSATAGREPHGPTKRVDRYRDRVAGNAGGRRARSLHLAVGLVVPGCLALAWWQVTRALSGNTLSWAYVFEWPIFAGYAVFMWWKLTHEMTHGTATGEPCPAKDLAVGELGTQSSPPSPVPEAPGPEGGADTTGRAPAVEHLHQSGPWEERADSGYEEDEELAAYNEYLASLNAGENRIHH